MDLVRKRNDLLLKAIESSKNKNQDPPGFIATVGEHEHFEIYVWDKSKLLKIEKELGLKM